MRTIRHVLWCVVSILLAIPIGVAAGFIAVVLLSGLLPGKMTIPLVFLAGFICAAVVGVACMRALTSRNPQPGSSLAQVRRLLLASPGVLPGLCMAIVTHLVNWDERFLLLGVLLAAAGFRIALSVTDAQGSRNAPKLANQNDAIPPT